MAPMLAQAIRERPLAADKRRAASRLKAWRERADQATLLAYDELAADVDLGGFLSALFDGSPYLHDLSCRDPARLVRLLAADPEAAFADLLALIGREAAGVPDDATLMQALRVAKQEAALLVALADVGGAWSCQQVMQALSLFAETALRASLRVLLRRLAGQGRLRLLDPDDPETGCGYFVLGMGKLGAGELNYSSDIDLIAFYDRDLVHLKDMDEHQAVFVRLTQTLTRVLNEHNHDGRVFRVDLRLRPDPGTYPVAISTVLARNYYEAVGQNWERAALIKARPVAGDITAGEAFLTEIRPFIWRKYLDYASIAEVHAMKRQIHAVKGHEHIVIEGHNLKLGRGGIREIEFFVQTQQLIGGGRNPHLRLRETLSGLRELARAGWISQAARRDLTEAYLMLRRLEHRAQMVNDEQTHTLPADAEALAAFARFAGFKTRAAFAKKLNATLTTVQQHYARLFESDPRTAVSRPLDFSGPVDNPETVDSLKRLGFAKPEAVGETVRRWQAGRYPATRTATARERLTEITPRLLEALSVTGQPDGALVAFDRFVGHLPAGVQVFSLLRSNPGLLDLFGQVLGTAPRLAQLLGRRPRVLEGLIEQLHAHTTDPLFDLDRRLDFALSDAGDYEDMLDRARVFTQEQLFLIGVRLLSGALDPAQAGPAFSRLADTVLRALHIKITAEQERRYGRPRKARSAIVALGKLGSQEMTASSDLDLILLYEDAFDAQTNGAKPLYASEYYIRLTQRLVAALSAPTAEGTIYAVDFRLRPSGNKGPLATSLSSFVDYQEREAWAWEQMALCRARVVSAPRELAAKVDSAIGAVLRRKRQPKKLIADIVDMRRVVRREKPAADGWDVKLMDGGLVDVEFLSQYLVLRHAHDHPDIATRALVKVFEAAREAEVLASGDAAVLIHAARLYTTVTQVLRLCLDEPFDPASAPKGLSVLLARATEAPDIEHLAAEVTETGARVKAVARRLWGQDPYE